MQSGMWQQEWPAQAAREAQDAWRRPVKFEALCMSAGSCSMALCLQWESAITKHDHGGRTRLGSPGARPQRMADSTF